MNRRRRIANWLALTLILSTAVATISSAENKPARPPKRVYPSTAKKKPPQRARPPKWSADVLDAFFPDAREKLVGARPNFEEAAEVVSNSSAAASSPTTATERTGAGTAWSKLIDAETVETEIKRIGKAVSVDVKTPSEFKAGGYKLCRQHFSVLAVLFAVDGEYDGQVRWQDAAPGLRDLFSRAGHNCKVGTDQTYREATERKQNLEELVRGTRPQVSEAEKTADWSHVADRPPLMQRLNIAQQDRLTKWLADEREFKKHAEDVKHEAQLIAVVADVIGRPGFEFADDEGYAGFARELRDSATEVSAAADQGNFEQAKKAADRTTKACADCHEGYRG